MRHRFIARFARRDDTDREVYRDAVIAFEDKSRDHNVRWIIAAGKANNQRAKGERLVRVSEAGYH